MCSIDSGLIEHVVCIPGIPSLCNFHISEVKDDNALNSPA